MTQSIDNMQTKLGLTDEDVAALVRYAVYNGLADLVEEADEDVSDEELEGIEATNAFVERVTAAKEKLEMVESASYE